MGEVEKWMCRGYSLLMLFNFGRIVLRIFIDVFIFYSVIFEWGVIVIFFL